MSGVKVFHHSLNCRGTLLDLSDPIVMGIINVTTDSFFEGSRVKSEEELLAMASRHIGQGAAILDVGAMSTRPGAHEIPLADEKVMLQWAVSILTNAFPLAIISVDTYRAAAARAALEIGAHMVNDVGGGQFDNNMFAVVGAHSVPYILMHNRATSDKMKDFTHYDDLMRELLTFFYHQEWQARQHGILDIVLDPGIGFSKTADQNFILMNRLAELHVVGCPLLMGLSRKSFIYKTIGGSAKDALNGTTAMHMVALQAGCKILRAHDTKEAIECIQLYNKMQRSKG